ncbi:hypothetical protein JCM33374_g4645 [Metschnikowia sp. JCM 33374]|nr:hypothetical protein JCM33374_g4645 [Metschnikowia sp. JCM 33374]
MSDTVSRAKEKLGQLSSAIVHLPSQELVGNLRNEVSHAATHVAHVLNPSPLAHAMGETVDTVDSLVGKAIGSNKCVDAAVSKAVEWNVKHVKQGKEAAKSMFTKLGKIDNAILNVKDKCLVGIMEQKAGNSIPEPIQRIFF